MNFSEEEKSPRSNSISEPRLPLLKRQTPQTKDIFLRSLLSGNRPINRKKKEAA